MQQQSGQYDEPQWAVQRHTAGGTRHSGWYTVGGTRTHSGRYNEAQWAVQGRTAGCTTRHSGWYTVGGIRTHSGRYNEAQWVVNSGRYKDAQWRYEAQWVGHSGWYKDAQWAVQAASRALCKTPLMPSWSTFDRIHEVTSITSAERGTVVTRPTTAVKLN